MTSIYHQYNECGAIQIFLRAANQVVSVQQTKLFQASHSKYGTTRYVDIFEEDVKDLDDATKVRLVLRKLDEQAHNRYINYILPKTSKELDFRLTIETLKHVLHLVKN